ASARRAASVLPENHGKRRENGTERTSAMAVTPALSSNDWNCSALRLEWPIVNRSNSIGGVITSLSASLLHLGHLNQRNVAGFTSGPRLGDPVCRLVFELMHGWGACDVSSLAMGGRCGCRRLRVVAVREPGARRHHDRCRQVEPAHV